ncbi:hypothetical protein [Streptomyces sp. cmx-4-7]|uniref:hypothetical protein n=1 Tax=Streptomyces sp. cmx-4-7 TaxID=2790939 RepID=UPI0039800D1F
MPGDWAHPWQFALVVYAVLAPLPPVVGFSRFVEGSGYVTVVGVTTAVVALPLMLHHRRAAFTRAAALGGAVLVPWIFVGSLIGMWTFAWSVPLMWAAAAADPRRRPVVAPVLFAVGTLLAVAIVALPGFWWQR